MALIIKEYIEGLCVGTKFLTLQIAPLGAHGAQGVGLALGVGHLDGFCQRCLVVDVKGYQDELLFQQVGHLRVGPYGRLHLATVDTAEASEVDEHGFTFCLGSCHALFIVRKAGLDGFAVQVEVLRADGGCEGTDGLAGSAPESWYHIDGKGQ